MRGAALPDVAGPAATPKVRFDDPMAVFLEQADAVAAEVAKVAPDEAIQMVEAVFEAAGEHRYLAWDGLDDFLPGVTGSLDRAGLEQVDARVSSDPAGRMDDHVRIGSAMVGITGADLGIAASGSLVLEHGPGRPRSASLLVEHHIALLPVECIVDSLEEAMNRVDLTETSNVAVITGPSRTGDIESILTLGVHGPRHLHIIVVE